MRRTPVLCLVLATTCLVVFSANASAAAGFSGSELIGLGERCLDVLAGGTAPGTPVVAFRCHGGANQEWTVPTRGFPGPIVGIGKQCLEPGPTPIAGGSELVVAPCDATASQRFTHRADGLLIAADGRCVAIGEGTAGNPVPLLLSECEGGPAQRWREDRPDEWLPTGLFGSPNVLDLEVVRIEPGAETVYAATDGDVFVSLDGGVSWSAARGLDQVTQNRLAVSPRDPRTLYVAGMSGLFRTVDGGRTWRPLLSLREESGRGLTTVFVDPLAPDTLFVGKRKVRSLRRSDDGGNTWRTIDVLADSSIIYDVVDLRRSANALVLALGSRRGCTSCEQGTYRSDDGGTSWEKTSDLASLRLEADPHSDTLYLLAESGLHRSTDSGRTWSLLPVAGSTADLRDLAFDPTIPGRLVLSTWQAGVYLSNDGGATWTAIDRGLLPREPTVAITARGRILVASRMAISFGRAGETGVFRSDDDGTTWTESTLGFLDRQSNGVSIDPRDPAHLLVASTNLEASFDGGQTWHRVFDVPPEGAFQAVTFDPHQPGRAFASFVGDPNYNIGSILRSLDSGETWQEVYRSSGQMAVEMVAFRNEGAGGILAAQADHLGGPPLLRSLDGGESWSRVQGVDPGGSGIAVDHGTGFLYASGFQGVYRSPDTFDWTFIHYAGQGGIAVDPDQPGTVYVATRTRIYRSNDSGEHWVELASPGDPRLNRLAVAPTGALWAGGSSGIYRSTDRGLSWHRFDHGLPTAVGFPTQGFAFDSADGVYSIRGWQLRRGTFGPREPLDFSSGRFSVSVHWSDGRGGEGWAHPTTRSLAQSEGTGAFWIFERENLEAVANVIDGTAINGHYWFYFASLSDLELEVEVVDELTGTRRRYRNPLGRFASFGDVAALPEFGGGALDLATGPSSGVGTFAFPAPLFEGTPEAAATLGLVDGRFEISVDWRDFTGRTGEGVPATLSSETIGFSFFDPRRFDLVVKVLDGRPINGHFWVFYGALSNVEYTLRVRDVQTGAVRIYQSPLGRFLSGGDTKAF